MSSAFEGEMLTMDSNNSLVAFQCVNLKVCSKTFSSLGPILLLLSSSIFTFQSKNFPRLPSVEEAKKSTSPLKAVVFFTTITYSGSVAALTKFLNLWSDPALASAIFCCSFTFDLVCKSTCVHIIFIWETIFRKGKIWTLRLFFKSRIVLDTIWNLL